MQKTTTHLRPPSPRSAEVRRGQPPKISEIQYENDPSTSVTEKSPRVRNRLSPTFVTDFVTVAVVTDNLESELSSTGIREIEILRDCNLPANIVEGQEAVDLFVPLEELETRLAS